MNGKYYNKRFLSVVIIAEIITFILINFLFYFAGSVKNFDFYPTYIVGILIFLICVAFMLPKYSNRLSIWNCQILCVNRFFLLIDFLLFIPELSN